MSYPPLLESIIAESCARFSQMLDDLPSTLAARSRAWVDSFTGGRTLSDVLQAPVSFPIALLPWWLEESLVGEADAEFQRELVYSAIAAYLSIRLHDDVMDREERADPALLPLAAVLYQEHILTFQSHFPAGSPFWNQLRAIWADSAAVTVQDADASVISEATFREASGRKCAAASVQLAAVCARRERLDLLAPWMSFVDALSRWHQFRHDLFDWHKDLTRGASTFILSQAARRKYTQETIEGWIFREGVSWARGYLKRLHGECMATARALGSLPLVEYIEERERAAEDRLAGLEAGIAAARSLFGE